MTKLRRLEMKADRLLQIKYVGLNPKCLVCGSPTREMHHFIPKSQSNKLRYDPDNLIPLCGGCHTKHHLSGDPRIVATIIDLKGDLWYRTLEVRRREICKFNIAYLQDIIKELGG